MSKGLHIAELTDHHIDSGIGYYSYELTRALQGLTSATLYKPYRNDHPDVSFHNTDWVRSITYRSFRQYRPYVLPFFLRAGLSPSSYDLVHAHWYLAGLASTYFSNTPVVVTMHDVSVLHTATTNDRYSKYYRWALRRFRDRSIPLIVVSEQAKSDTIKHADYPEELVHAVHNGLNSDRFYPIEKKKSGPFTIVYSGGLGSHKNLELLLSALTFVQQRYPEVSLKIAGGSPQNTQYPALAEQLRLKHVNFTGFIPDKDMNEFYNSGDLMVYTSLYEGFGMAPLEAMSCGVPVITTGGGALREVSGGGAVITEYDAECLAGQIVDMIEDPAYRSSVARKGAEWVKQYTWEQTATKTMNIYEEVL